jgi:hypothetical protein
MYPASWAAAVNVKTRLRATIVHYNINTTDILPCFASHMYNQKRKSDPIG